MKRKWGNNVQVGRARCLCLARDGYYCILCKKRLDTSIVAQVHHLDGNPNNNPENGSNWGLVHNSCNIVEFYARKRLQAIDGERPPPFEYTMGSKMELAWLRWLIDEITTRHSITWDEARYTGALEANCSPETTKRYLLKHVTNSDHPKALFKSKLDRDYNSEITFTSAVEEFFEMHKDEY